MTHYAKLEQYGLLQATGADARAFLHAQLTSDIEKLQPDRARYAGWCTAQGRLLASFLVVPYADGFLLQLARDLAPAVLKRLSMFVLRSKVKLADVSGQWSQFGAWGEAAGEPLSVLVDGGRISVRIDSGRSLVLAQGEPFAVDRNSDDWALAQVRAGLPLIVQSTQAQFVPQMVNLELAGGVDFRKGCYPGQEIVARAQYRGAVKRRMYRLRGERLQPGQDLFSDAAPEQAIGKVVNVAGEESLAVLQIAVVESRSPIHARPPAPALEVLPLTYTA